MLGCAITEGLLTGKKFSPVVKIVCENLWTCKNESLIESSLTRGKSYRIPNNNYATIIRGDGRGPRAQRRAPHCCGSNSNAGLIQITRRLLQTKPYDVKTDLPKDVIIYKYENAKYFRRLNIFGISQLLFWGYLSHFVFTGLKDIPVSKVQTDELPWWGRINLGEKTYRTILTSVTFLVGYSLFVISWVHTLKSVRYLVLRKGGNDVTFVTYTPLGGNRLRTVPLAKVTSKQSREAANVQLPIKVKGDMMHYLLDMRGEFRHPTLFDFTAGLKRPI